MTAGPEVLGVTHTAVAPPLPAGSCDCHTHVFGPAAQFPFDPSRTYTPGPAGVSDLLAHQRALGLDRVVVVQASPYGTDNACTLDAVRRIGAAGRAVAVIDPALSPAALQALHDGGVRGVRINLETAGRHDPADAARRLREAAETVAPLGWHVQVYTNLAVLAAAHGTLRDLAVPLVVDHFGRAMARAGVSQPGFDALLDLVRSGKAYVKLSAAHRIAPGMPDEAEPIARALIAANPARLLWGSDWPHTSSGSPARVQPFNPVDDGAAIRRLRRWCGSADALRAILVTNPARLYGFDRGDGEMT